MIAPASESASRDADQTKRNHAKRDLVGPRRIAIAAGAAVGLLLALLVALTLIEHHNYAGRVLPGVKLDGVSASGRNKVAVYDDVARLAVSLEKSPLRVNVDGHPFAADPSLLDASIDASTVIAHSTKPDAHAPPDAAVDARVVAIDAR